VSTAPLEESVEIEKELPIPTEVDTPIEGEAARGSYSRKWYASLMVFFEDGILTDHEAGSVSRQLVGDKLARHAPEQSSVEDCLKLDDIIDTTCLSRSPLIDLTSLSFCSLFVNGMCLL
jgi:hypothetical protein